MNIEEVKERLQRLADQARCVGCYGTKKACDARRGEDPDAPPWFGCCAIGGVGPCQHIIQPSAVLALIEEITNGK